jgi:threonine/homoserine/homoserine lactone efflux protein
VFGTQNLALFAVSGILLNLTPGQDTFYILGRSIAQGRRAGILSVLGITSGSALHTLAAAFGLSAILATSASAFLIVKAAGAAYLVYLGVSMLRDRTPGTLSTRGTPGTAGTSDWATFRAGMLTNVLNPKVALFFLAFLPQFVDPAAESKVLAFLFLGAVFMFNGTIWCLILAWSASAMSRRFLERNAAKAFRQTARPSAETLLKRAAGALFIGLGVRLAVSK